MQSGFSDSALANATEGLDLDYIGSLNHAGENWHLTRKSSHFSTDLASGVSRSGHRSYTSFVRFVPKYFLLFDDIMSDTIF